MATSMLTTSRLMFMVRPPSQFLDITSFIVSLAADLDSWMSFNCLSLNPSKTQLI